MGLYNTHKHRKSYTKELHNMGRYSLILHDSNYITQTLNVRHMLANVEVTGIVCTYKFVLCQYHLFIYS